MVEFIGKLFLICWDEMSKCTRLKDNAKGICRTKSMIDFDKFGILPEYIALGDLISIIVDIRNIYFLLEMKDKTGVSIGQCLLDKWMSWIGTSKDIVIFQDIRLQTF